MDYFMRHSAGMIFLAGCGLACLALGAGFLFIQSHSFCNPPLPGADVSIGANVFRVEMATTETEQACGLSGRETLGQNQGMYFPFTGAGPQRFWMKDMRFPVDIVWVGGGKVIGVTQNARLQPDASLSDLIIYPSPDGADAALEIPAGTAERDRITAGDPVVANN